MQIYDIAIVGGGASGMAAAIAVKQLAPQCGVVLLERQDRVGRKLAATGNGRCNLTNTHPILPALHGATTLAATALAGDVFARIEAFFAGIGVVFRADDAGRVYPMGDQATGVLDALRLALDEMRIEVVTGFSVAAITPGTNVVFGTNAAPDFLIRGADARTVRARKLVLATGGKAAPKLGGNGDGLTLARQLGHRATATYPALAPLVTDPEPIRALKGIRFAGEIALGAPGEKDVCESGEILFGEGVLSGIAAMALARTANIWRAEGKRVRARLRMLPYSEAALLHQLRSRRAALPARTLENFLTGLTNKRLGQTLCKQSGILPLSREARSLSDAELTLLARKLLGWELPVYASAGYEQAQVMAGGVDARAIDHETLMSLLRPDLYFVGELVDIDGDCGGFNLTWAWASALLAARAIAKRL